VLDAVARTEQPVAVLTGLPSALDTDAAALLRDHGVPVLEGYRSGLAAIGHVLDAPTAPTNASARFDRVRQARWRERLAAGSPLDAVESFALLADYGVPAVATQAAESEATALLAARSVGYPVAMKTAEPGVAHKTDLDGVRLGVADDDALRAAYAELADALGSRVSVSTMASPGVEFALGIAADPHLGPLVVVAAGGTATELLADRVVAVPPLDRDRARRLIGRLRIAPLLSGWRGTQPVDVASLADAVVAVGVIACELGDDLTALDVNPIIASAAGAVAVDALVVPSSEVSCTA